MKNVLCKITAVAAVCVMLLSMLPMAALPVSAEYTSGDFDYEVENGKATIVYYYGSATHLTVPSTLGKYTVASIGDGAFCYCDSLESVTIPDSVTTIASYAFAFCVSLKSVTIPDSVTSIGEGAFGFCESLTAIKVNADNAVYSDIDGVLFSKNKKTLLQYPAGKTASSYAIPDDVTTIGAEAFCSCPSLVDVAIGNSVTVIKEYAFALCESLTGVTMGNRVKTIGEGAFSDCYALENVTIPDSVTVIKEYAFAVCESLTSVTIGNGVKAIGEGAFYDCYALSDVYYGGSKAEWNDIVIDGWNTDLTSATIHYTNPVVKITAESATAAYAAKDAVASASVTATGDGLTYTWYIKNPGAAKYSKSSVTTNTYKVKMTAANSGRLVYCVVKDKYGNEVRSKTFVLRMKATITSVPATAAYAKLGEKVSVKIAAAGDGLTYTWYIKNAGGTKYSKSSVTSATYATTMSSAVKGRLVYCVVKDKYGKTAQTKTFVLREAVSIITQPKSTTVSNGETAKVSVKASGDGLSYAWYIKNAGQTKYSKSSITGPTYTTKMSSTTKDRLVVCKVTDQYGNMVQANTVQLKMK